MRSSRLFPLVLFATSSLPAQRVDTMALRGSRPCSTCITVTPEATLALPDSLGSFLSPYGFGRSSTGDFFARDPFGVLGVHMFAPDGRHLRTFGKRGGGPGEFSNIDAFAIDRYDTVRVFGSKQSVFLTNGRHIRSRSFVGSARPTHAGYLSNGRLVVAGASLSPEKAGVPFHLLADDGAVLLSFGDRVGSNYWDAPQSIAADRSGGFYTARANRYVIEQWSSDGRLLRVFRRPAEWFSDWTEWDGRADETTPVQTCLPHGRPRGTALGGQHRR